MQLHDAVQTCVTLPSCYLVHKTMSMARFVANLHHGWACHHSRTVSNLQVLQPRSHSIRFGMCCRFQICGQLTVTLSHGEPLTAAAAPAPLPHRGVASSSAAVQTNDSGSGTQDASIATQQPARAAAERSPSDAAADVTPAAAARPIEASVCVEPTGPRAAAGLPQVQKAPGSGLEHLLTLSDDEDFAAVPSGWVSDGSSAGGLCVR